MSMNTKISSASTEVFTVYLVEYEKCLLPTTSSNPSIKPEVTYFGKQKRCYLQHGNAKIGQGKKLTRKIKIFKEGGFFHIRHVYYNQHRQISVSITRNFIRGKNINRQGCQQFFYTFFGENTNFLEVGIRNLQYFRVYGCQPNDSADDSERDG